MDNDLPPLAQGDLAPSFTLQDQRGEPVTRAQFRDRQQLILVFSPADSLPESLLSGLEAQRERLEWLDTQVLAILPVLPPDLPAARGVVRPLADPDLLTTCRFTSVPDGRPRVAVVVLDRYGAFERRWVAPDLPPAAEIMGVVERLAHLCAG